MTKEREHEEHLQALTKETIHRANNLLAIISTLIHNTQGTDVKSFRETLDGRVRNLALVNQALVASEWRDVTNYQIVHMSLKVYGEKRYKVSGDVHLLDPRAAQAASMMIHELATNSAKHGALSNRTGKVEVEFYSESGRAGFRWIEKGGPKVMQAPEETGLGMKVIMMTARQFGGATIMEWRPEGLFVDCHARLSKSIRIADPSYVQGTPCVTPAACADCPHPCGS
jgi:two-component sensor histidine kinase